MRILLPLFWLIVFSLQAQHPFTIEVEELNTGSYTPGLGVTAAGDHYYVNTAEGCFYYADLANKPKQMLCDGGNLKTRFQRNEELFIVSSSSVSDSTFVYYVDRQAPKQIESLLRTTDRLTGIRATGDGGFVFVRNETDLVHIDTQGKITTLHTAFPPAQQVRLTFGYRGWLIMSTSSAIWATDMTAAGTRQISEIEAPYRGIQFGAFENKLYWNTYDTRLYGYALDEVGEAEVVYEVESIGDQYTYFSNFTVNPSNMLFVVLDDYQYLIKRIPRGGEMVEAVTLGEDNRPTEAWGPQHVQRLSGGRLLYYDLHNDLIITNGTAEESRQLSEDYSSLLDKDRFGAYETNEGDILYLANEDRYPESPMVRYDAEDEKTYKVDVSAEYLNFISYRGIETDDAVVFYSTDQGRLQKYDKRTDTYLDYAKVNIRDVGRSVTKNGYLLYTTSREGITQLLGLDLSRAEPTEPVPLLEGFSSITLFDLNGEPYILASRQGEGTYLYRSDGTPEGTRVVYELFSRSGDAAISGLFPDGDILYAVERGRYHSYQDGRIRSGVIPAGGPNPTKYLGSRGGIPVFASSDEILIPNDRIGRGFGSARDVNPSVLGLQYAYLLTYGNNMVRKFSTRISDPRYRNNEAQSDFLHDHSTAGRHTMQMVRRGDALYFTTPAPTDDKMLWWRHDLRTNATDQLDDSVLDYPTGARHTLVYDDIIYYSTTDRRGDGLLQRATLSGPPTTLAELETEETFIDVITLGAASLAVTSRQIVDAMSGEVIFAAPTGVNIRRAAALDNQLILALAQGQTVSYGTLTHAGGELNFFALEQPGAVADDQQDHIAVLEQQALFSYLRADGMRQFAVYDGERDTLYDLGATSALRLSRLSTPILTTFQGEFFYMFADERKGVELHHFRPEPTAELTGVVFQDVNGDGTLDATEDLLVNRAVVAEGGGRTITTYTDTLGRYRFLLDIDVDYTIYLPEDDCVERFNATVSVNIRPTDAEAVVHDFAVPPLQSTAAVDVRVDNFSIQCGFTELFWVTVTNSGCGELTAGEVSMTLHPAVDFVDAFDAVQFDQDSVRLTWAYENLSPGEQFVTAVELRMPKEEYTGEVIRMELSGQATDRTGDRARDTFQFAEVLTCAFDPNDKRSWPARPEETMSNYTQLDEPITYMIRFQNTGNDTAVTVRLEDRLSTGLDWSTFRPLAASHHHRVSLREGGNLEVVFDQIMLPDSNVNEPESHGFFTFEIIAREGLADFTAIENTAGIYFDFNKPIITNTTTNTLVEALDADADGFMFFEECNDQDRLINPGAPEIPGNGIDENCDGVDGTTSVTAFSGQIVELAPNPTRATVRLRLAEAADYHYALYSLRGRRVARGDFRGETELDLSTLPRGTYLLRVTDAAGAGVTRRVVRQ